MPLIFGEKKWKFFEISLNENMDKKTVWCYLKILFQLTITIILLLWEVQSIVQ